MPLTAKFLGHTKLLLLSCVGLSSCAMSGDTTATSTLGLSESPTVSASAVGPQSGPMPFDAINFAAVDEYDRVVSEYQNKCAGISPTRTSSDPKSNSIASVFQLNASTSFGTTSVEDARAFGLHDGPIQSVPVNQSNKESSALLGQCYEQALTMIPAAAQSSYAVGFQLLDDASRVFFTGMAPKFEANEIETRQCAVAAGWTAASDQALNDWTVPVSQVFGVQVGTLTTDEATGVQSYIPQPRETELALTLADCRSKLNIGNESMLFARTIEQSFIDSKETEIQQFGIDMAQAVVLARDALT